MRACRRKVPPFALPKIVLSALLPPNREPVSQDTRELGRRLEDSIVDQFSVNTRCAGAAAYIEGYDKFDGKFNAVAMQAEELNDYWDLMVDYAPGSKVYRRALFPTARSGRPNGRMISGEGTVSQIAEQVCIVVTGHGASVR
jgi:hypothetical protein